MKVENILIITYWSFDEALIQTYTLPYVRIIQRHLPPGGKVFLLTLEKKKVNQENDSWDHRKASLKESGICWIPFMYYPFGLRATVQWLRILTSLFFLIFRERINMIHCWCTPAGAAGYWLSLLTGRKLIIDSYEPHAEAMVQNGTWKKNSVAFRLLFWLEKLQTQHASFVISTTMAMKDYARSKYKIDIRNFHVKPACVDLNLFSEKNIKEKSFEKKFSLEGKIVCVYTGKFGGIYLDREVFDFFRTAIAHWGERFRAVILTPHSRAEITAFCEAAGISSDIIISVFVSHHDVPHYLGLGDFAISPVKPIPSKRYCSPIKDGEYWAMGLPVVIPSNISDDSEIIEANLIGSVLKTLDEPAYRKAILEIESLLLGPREILFKRIRSIASKYRSFEIAESVYHEIYGNRS